MTMEPQDRELVAAYAHAGAGSEAAFHALVRRHVALVYATAFRQLGDRGLAEEVTQNVFVALARKAPRLAGLETLAGWLHRTAVLETKAHIRAELRRRQRETVAGQLAELRAEGTSVLDALVPLLDEALLNLRESDRLALVLRFLEDRPLREVGELLGVEEDAARKRVSRAVERVADFFRQRGFALPSGGTGGGVASGTAGGAAAGFAAVAAHGAQAVPAGLAASTAAAGLAAGGTATGFAALTTYFMAMTKTQTATLCAVLAIGPLAWQWQARSAARGSGLELGTAVAAEQAALGELESEAGRLRMAFLRAEAETLTARGRLAALATNRGTSTAKAYRWDDASPVVRVPKAALRQMELTSVGDKRGRLTPQIKEALQLTEAEAAQVQAAIGRFLASYHAVEAARVKVVEPTEGDLNGHRPEETRVFELPDLKPEVAGLRANLLEELRLLLDPPRMELLTRGLDDWMPMDDEFHGMNSSMAVFNTAHRLRFYATSGESGGEPYLDWGVSDEHRGTMNLPIRLDEIPGYLQPHLQDWIAEARKAHAEHLRRATPAPAKP